MSLLGVGKSFLFVDCSSLAELGFGDVGSVLMAVVPVHFPLAYKHTRSLFPIASYRIDESIVEINFHSFPSMK